MRLVTFERAPCAEPGVLMNEEVVSLRNAGFSDVLSVIQGGAVGLDRVRQWLLNPPWGDITSIREVKLLAPIQTPRLLCVGLNYRDHAREAHMEIPGVPTIFAKLTSALTGAGQPIILPRSTSMADYEGELAFVIGKRARHVPPEQWRDYVFGYANFNDVSARDHQQRTSQWTLSKSFDTFAPMGPAIVSADEIADPHALEITTTVSGEVLQQGNTSDMIFKIPDLVAYLSSIFTLDPGDVIATGTPAGVGFARRPPRWLKPGDEAVVHIHGLGELRNPVIAEGETG